MLPEFAVVNRKNGKTEKYVSNLLGVEMGYSTQIKKTNDQLHTGKWVFGVEFLENCVIMLFVCSVSGTERYNNTQSGKGEM